MADPIDLSGAPQVFRVLANAYALGGSVKNLRGLLGHQVVHQAIEWMISQQDPRVFADAPGIVGFIMSFVLALPSPLRLIVFHGVAEVLETHSLVPDALRAPLATAFRAVESGITAGAADMTDDDVARYQARLVSDVTQALTAAGIPPAGGGAPPPPNPVPGAPPPQGSPMINLYLAFLALVRPLREADVLNAPAGQRVYWSGLDWVRAHENEVDAAGAPTPAGAEAQAALALLPQMTQAELTALDGAFQTLNQVLVLNQARAGTIPADHAWRVEATRQVTAQLNRAGSAAWETEIRRLARIRSMSPLESLWFPIRDMADDWSDDAGRAQLRNFFGGGFWAQVWQFFVNTPILGAILAIIAAAVVVLGAEVWNADDVPANTPNQTIPQRLRRWAGVAWSWISAFPGWVWRNIRMVVGWTLFSGVMLAFGVPFITYLFLLLWDFRSLFHWDGAVVSLAYAGYGNGVFSRLAFEMNDMATKAYILRYFIMIGELILASRLMFGIPAVIEFEEDAAQRRRDRIARGLPADDPNFVPTDFAGLSSPGDHPTDFTRVRSRFYLLRVWFRLGAVGYIRPHVITLCIIIEAVMMICNGYIFAIHGLGQTWSDFLATGAWMILLLIDCSIRFGGWFGFDEREAFIKSYFLWLFRSFAPVAVLALIFGYLITPANGSDVVRSVQQTGDWATGVQTPAVPVVVDSCQEFKTVVLVQSPDFCVHSWNKTDGRCTKCK